MRAANGAYAPRFQAIFVAGSGSIKVMLPRPALVERRSKSPLNSLDISDPAGL